MEITDAKKGYALDHYERAIESERVGKKKKQFIQVLAVWLLM